MADMRAGASGRLVLVATPIGNLEDLSPRATRTLAEADVVCCEDTRRTRKLITHAGIRVARLVAIHGHNEAQQVGRVLGWLEAGETVAVVSDAGLPGISDPGERLVAAAAAGGFMVEVVPGPSAAVAALVVSGLPTGRFVFEGFLPTKGSERAERLAALAVEPRTAVLFEAPHRLAGTLADLVAICESDRLVAVVRELTKVHEQVVRGTIGEAAAAAQPSEETADPRGEHVIVLGGAASGPEATDSEVVAAIRGELAAGASRRDAAASVAEALSVPRRRAYNLVLGLPADGEGEGDEPLTPVRSDD